MNKTVLNQILQNQICIMEAICRDTQYPHVADDCKRAIKDSKTLISPKEELVIDILSFRERRKLSGLTLHKVELLTGISNAYLSQLETGKIKKPSYDTVKKLNDLYNNSPI